MYMYVYIYIYIYTKLPHNGLIYFIKGPMSSFISNIAVVFLAGFSLIIRWPCTEMTSHVSSKLLLWNPSSHLTLSSCGRMCDSKDYRSQESLQWRHNGRDSVSNHQPYDCLLNRLFRRRSKKTSKLRVTGLCVGNSPVTGEFLAKMASNAKNVSIWWRHHYHAPDWHFVGICWGLVQVSFNPLQWRHNERVGFSNHLRSDCLLSRLFRRR